MDTSINSTKGAVFTHRLAYQLTIGAIPEGLNVLHRCDNPPCCNPDHLFLGTNADNAKDMVNKGRQNFGERNPNAKLCEIDVVAIRHRAKQGESPVSLSKEYSVHTFTIVRIIRRQLWKHI